MDPRFIPIETVPSKTPFGLDQLRRSYKTALSAEDAIAAAPSVGTVDDSFPNMFLMPINTPEAAESATRIDLVYQGSLQGADGSPVLPAQKHDSDNAVQSASSSRSSVGLLATPPITVQFYAPSTSISYISYGGPGAVVASDPTDDVQVITMTIGDATLAITTGTEAYIVSVFFSEQIIETHKSSEIVPGKYWQNESRKVKSLSPFIVSIAPGPYATLYAPGTGYTVGDTLSISAGGHLAVVVVTVVGVSMSVRSYTQSSNNFVAPQTGIAATGGTGSGAEFNVVIVV